MRSIKKRKATSYKSLDRNASLNSSLNSNVSTGYENEGLDMDPEERSKRELERQQHKLYADSQKELRLAAILQLQEQHQTQKPGDVETIDDRLRDTEGGRPLSPDGERHLEMSYPDMPMTSRFSWIDSMTSSLNSSFTSQSQLIVNGSRVKEEVQVESRIRTEELVFKVNEALKCIQLKPSLSNENPCENQSKQTELPICKSPLAENPDNLIVAATLEPDLKIPTDSLPSEANIGLEKVKEIAACDGGQLRQHSTPNDKSENKDNNVTMDSSIIYLTGNQPNQSVVETVSDSEGDGKNDIELQILRDILTQQGELREAPSPAIDSAQNHSQQVHLRPSARKDKRICCIIL